MKRESAIRQMYYGNRGQEKLSKMSLEYRELFEEQLRYENELREKMKDMPEILELYEKAEDSSDAVHSEDLAEHYAAGFKFGILIGMEIAFYDDEL